MPVVRGRTCTFGVFSFDLASGALRRNGYLLHLTDQHTRLLSLLIENAGELVDRDVLRERLWPEGEHVDFDHAISNAVRHLRLALRDNPRTPKFIATIPKRGYRFIAPITVVDPVTEEQQTPSEVEIPSPAPDLVSALAVPLEVDPAPPLPIQVGPIKAPPLKARPNGLAQRSLFWAAALLLPILSFGGFLLWRHSHPATPQQDVYMVIAPFATTGPGGQLGESFRMELANAISILPGVQVIAAHSMPNSSPSDAELKRLGSQLHVDVYVLGSLQEQNRDCVLELELVRARDAVHLASFRYSASVDDLETLRDRVQGDIAQRLDLVRYATRPAPTVAANPKAYESYLRGRYHLLQLTDSSLQLAVEEFNTAILLDPHSAKAYAGKADAYIAMADHDVLPTSKGYAMARDLALNVVQMDPNSAEGHALLGFVYLTLDWRLADAEVELRKAVELDPRSARYHDWLAIVYCVQNRVEESYKEIDLAHAADPFWPPVYLTEAYVASAAHDRRRMYESCQKLLRLRPDWTFAHNQYAWIAWYSGDYELAVNEWIRTAELNHDKKRVAFERAGLNALHTGGSAAYARLRLQAARNNPEWMRDEHEFAPAEWNVYANNNEAALREIAAMIDRRDVASIEVGINPVYDSLRSDARFRAQVARVVGPKLAGQLSLP